MKNFILLGLMASVFIYFSPDANATVYHRVIHHKHHRWHHRHHHHHKHHR